MQWKDLIGLLFVEQARLIVPNFISFTPGQDFVKIIGTAYGTLLRDQLVAFDKNCALTRQYPKNHHNPMPVIDVSDGKYMSLQEPWSDHKISYRFECIDFTGAGGFPSCSKLPGRCSRNMRQRRSVWEIQVGRNEEEQPWSQARGRPKEYRSFA